MNDQCETVPLGKPFQWSEACARMMANMPDTDEARELVARIYGEEMMEYARPLADLMRGGRR